MELLLARAEEVSVLLGQAGPDVGELAVDLGHRLESRQCEVTWSGKIVHPAQRGTWVTSGHWGLLSSRGSQIVTGARSITTGCATSVNIQAVQPA
jgi:hypothetical protein